MRNTRTPDRISRRKLKKFFNNEGVTDPAIVRGHLLFLEATGMGTDNLSSLTVTYRPYPSQPFPYMG